MVLAGHDILVMDTTVLRRLDRIDTVVVDADLVETRSDGSDALVSAIRAAAQDFVVASAGADASKQLEPDLVVGGGQEMAREVRRLQEEGRVVAVVSAGRGDALAAADCGVGVIAPDELPPWGADVLCPTLHGAALVVQATAVARTASHGAVTIAMAGSAAAAALALGQQPGAGHRAMLATNGAALVALGAGTRAGATLAHRLLPADDLPDVEWHALGTDEVATRLATGAAGLDAEAVEARRREVPRVAGPGFLSLVAEELANPLTLVLGAGGVLSTITGSVTDGMLIGGVLGVNALVGAAQRLRTDRSINRLNAAVSSELVRIRRVGRRALGAAERARRRRPHPLADRRHRSGRLSCASRSPGLEADESALTGESLPVAKSTEPTASDAAVADRRSMTYAGTAVAAGRRGGHRRRVRRPHGSPARHARNGTRAGERRRDAARAPHPQLRPDRHRRRWAAHRLESPPRRFPRARPCRPA